MEISDVQDAITEAADALAIVAPDISSSKGKAFEVWVLLEIADRLRKAGVSVMAHNNRDETVDTLRVSGAPAQMPAYVDDPNIASGHFVFGRGAVWYELHLGLQVQGVSQAPHELDISVLPALAAVHARYEGGGYYAGPVVKALELKAYSAKHKLDHNIARALIGVAVDLDPSWVFERMTLHTPGGSRIGLRRENRTLFGLLTTTQLFDTSVQLLEHYDVHSAGGVLPDNDGAIDAIVNALMSRLPAPSRPAHIRRPRNIRPVGR